MLYKIGTYNFKLNLKKKIEIYFLISHISKNIQFQFFYSNVIQFRTIKIIYF